MDQICVVSALVFTVCSCMLCSLPFIVSVLCSSCPHPPSLKSGAVVPDCGCLAGGFDALPYRLELHASPNKLPTSHTCSFHLKVPHCLHLEEMSSALSIAIARHEVGFGFVWRSWWVPCRRFGHCQFQRLQVQELSRPILAYLGRPLLASAGVSHRAGLAS